MFVLLLKFGVWRVAWSAIACGVVLIVLIAPAFGASPRDGDDRNCAVTVATPRPDVTPGADDEDGDQANEQDEDCPTPTPTPRATPTPTPRPTPHRTPKPAACTENEQDNETDDD